MSIFSFLIVVVIVKRQISSLRARRSCRTRSMGTLRSFVGVLSRQSLRGLNRIYGFE